MQPLDAWESVCQEVGVLELLRSRTRTRRRRRRRSWGALWTCLLPVVLVYATLWIGPVLLSVYMSCDKGHMAGSWRVCMSLHAAIDAAN
jgi:hypothetical protein